MCVSSLYLRAIYVLLACCWHWVTLRVCDACLSCGVHQRAEQEREHEREKQVHVLKAQAEADKLKLSQELEAIKTADQERRQQMTDLSERLAAAQTENRHLLDQLEDKAARLQVN